MKKVSSIFLKVAFILSIVLAALCVVGGICSIICFIPAIQDGIRLLIERFDSTLTPQEIDDIMIAFNASLGSTIGSCFMTAVFCVGNIIVVRIMQQKVTKAACILNIIFGILSGIIFNTVAGILSIIVLSKEGNKQEAELVEEKPVDEDK